MSRGSTGAARLAALIACLVVADCSTQRTPAAPRLAADPATAPAVVGSGQLQPYLDAYPLGDAASRVDLIAVSPARSLHLVQTRTAITRHMHALHTETTYVVTGSGTCWIGDRAYPAKPGSTFKIAKGVPHSVLPDVGSTLVALAYFEPSLEGDDDRISVK